ncbi:zinc ABC transporter substrate-binding protein [Rhodomicrobium sp. Az07]|uniref:zinc ABC transporter substrate-binding protein n=1 Tax=Rhodomicrobium sp. Az07 TaxID=2839034 RepID=UPI001BEAC0C3|nr:zinc ABC transporter substrate-binding protein [Rhodomicrobium sp. Az07]MBT3072134.1 zinc ABC transporter substrate-binding protein [Rhodomicrobium sp. Az07]
MVVRLPWRAVLLRGSDSARRLKRPLAAGRAVLAFLFSALAIATPSLAAPKVVATIKPVHSLAAAIMAGVAEPKLLLDGAASPHFYALKPSDARALEGADLVIRVSPHLEVFLDRALASLPEKARVLDLDRSAGLNLLAVRASHGASSAAGSAPDQADVHFWLDPVNAGALAREIARQLSAIDPENAAHYGANATALGAKLTELDVEMRKTLAGLSGRPFVVFHDVTQYLEHRYGLNSLGTVTPSPERTPGAGSVAALRDAIREKGAVCIFAEPQFSPRLIDMLVEGTNARRGILDEIGVRIEAGPEQYFNLMRANARSIADCLRP